MKMKRMVPIVTISTFEGIKEFYQKHFGFKVTVESEEFLSLAPEKQEEIEISFMKPNGSEQPEFNQQGLTYCFEVEDVDAEYQRLTDESVTFHQPVQDNPWGDRSFIVSAPAGISLYIYKQTPPTEEYKQYYQS